MTKNTSNVRQDSLTYGQLIISVLFGWILWYAGVLFIKHGGAAGFYDGNNIILVYLAILVATYVAIKIAMLIGKVPPYLALNFVGLATAAAITLDALALIWLRDIYGTDTELVLRGAASIIWGAAVPIFIALQIEAKHRRLK